MKQKHYLIFGIIIVVVLIGIILAIRPISKNTEMFTYPAEYGITRDYINLVKGINPASTSAQVFDSGTIEATVLSLTKSEICPYQEENCSIEPYPNDVGTIRIDKVNDYTSYLQKTASQPIEQPGGTSTGGENTSGNRGVDIIPKTSSPTYQSLKVSQNVSAKFLLTARPVKVNYVSVAPSMLESSRQAVDDTLSQTIQPGKTIFKPIPKEGNYFVFTTKILPYPETSQKSLAGLKEGNKFRAKVDYNGIVYVDEYEIIS